MTLKIICDTNSPLNDIRQKICIFVLIKIGSLLFQKYFLVSVSLYDSKNFSKKGS